MSGMKPLQIVARAVMPQCREIAIAGELDLATTPALAQPLRDTCDAAEHLVINLKDCEFIDSTGIAAIVTARNELVEAGRQLILFGASAQILRILEITGLTGHGLCANDLDAALAMCGQRAGASEGWALSG